MRYGLLNYIRNVMIQDVTNGIPMIRTILYENPNEQPKDKTDVS